MPLWKSALVAAAAVAAVGALPQVAAVGGDGIQLEDVNQVAASLRVKDAAMARDPLRFREKLADGTHEEPQFFDQEDDARAASAASPVVMRSASAPSPSQQQGQPGPSRGLRSAASTYRFRGTAGLSLEQRVMYERFVELRTKSQREGLTAAEKEEMEAIRSRGFFDAVANVGKSILKGVGNTVSAIMGGPAVTGVKDKDGNIIKMQSEDVEDCVACRYVWLAVEMQVSSSRSESEIYDAFVNLCVEAEKAPIFSAACQDMFDDVYGMIGDYIDGFTVNQMCEGAKMCR